MSDTRADQGQLERMRRRLERWRQRYGGRGRPIPAELWEQAACVARVEGVAPTARALRLDRYRLAQRAGGGASDAIDGPNETEATGAFVELDASRLSLGARTVVRFASRDGDRLEIELGGVPAVDLVALAATFWRRSSRRR
jgi:hypothetical protein